MSDTKVSEGDEKLLRIDDVAEMLNVSPQTIRNWRCEGKGPVAVVFGRRLRWRRSAVADWIAVREEPRVNG